MRILLLHNPDAGDGDVPTDRLEAIFREAGHGVATGDHRDVDPAAAGAADAVVVAGGDGTVSRVMRALGPGRAPFALLPLGGSNNIAGALGSEGNAEDFGAGLGAAAERWLDIGRADGPWGSTRFLEGVGLGPVAAMIEAGPKGLSPEEKRGFARTALLDFMRRAEPERWRVRVDGAELPEALVLVEALNIGVAGAGVPLAPEARPDDGALDVAFLEPDLRDAFLAWLDGGAQGAGPARIARGAEAALTWTGGPLRIDDRLPDRPEGPVTVVLRLEPEAARILVPPAR